MSSPRAPTIARPAATYLLRLRRAPLQIFETINMTCLGIVGEHLTKNLRMALLDKLLHLEVGYFDHEENSMGALTEFLGRKVTLMQGLVGEKLGMMAQSVVMLVSTIFTMFYWGDWRVSLIVLGCLPITGALMSIAMASMIPEPRRNQWAVIEAVD